MSRMLFRLLLVVLILVGQVPVGVCTCAASEAGHRHTTELPAAVAPSCCEHWHHAPDADEPAEPCSTPLADDLDPDGHHPSCPAASPRPALAAAPTAPVETGPTAAAADVILAPPLILITSAAPHSAPLRPHGYPVPLFISLLVLRI